MTQRDAVKPEWAKDRHMVDYVEYRCAHCLRDGKIVELELEKSQMEPGWMGVNWENTYCERVKCPECGHSGHIRSRKMKKSYKGVKFVRDGVAADPDWNDVPDELQKVDA